MQRSIEIPFGEQLVQVILSAVDVRLLAYPMNPGHINPDFLSANGVVPRDWSIQRPVTLESRFTRIAYENGVVVTATDNYASFAQRNLNAPDEELMAPAITRRYLDYPPDYLQFTAVGINFTSDVSLSSHAGPGAPPRLSALAVPFREIVPDVAIRSIYRLDNRRMVVTVSEEPSGRDDGVTFVRIRGQVTFRLLRDTPTENLAVAQRTLAEWETALEMFFDVSQSLCSRHINFGGLL